jgi:3-oxoacyl-[acyl-carrier-protein] synthase I
VVFCGTDSGGGLTQSIAFTGCSLVCSLGLDAATACAALRAGIVRPTMIDTFPVGTLDDFGGATVHAAPVVAHGFEGHARLLRLLHAAFENLMARQPDAPWRSARTSFYLSLPHPDREHTGFELIPDEDLRRQEVARWEEAQATRQAHGDWGKRATSLIEQAAVLADWGQPVHLRAYSMTGNTGVAELIDAASQDLNGGAVELAVIGGVDSWIDTPSLRWLERRGRLKSPAMPVGLAPGEAAGFLLMETAPRAQSRSAEILAVLRATVLDHEENAHLAGKMGLGEALARVLAATAPLAAWSPDAPPWLVVDQNGERYRAREWGCALTRLVEAHPAFQDPVLWYPVTSVGDTGAATGAVQTCVALQAFCRRYAPARQVVLLAGADAGQRSATLLGSAA